MDKHSGEAITSKCQGVSTNEHSRVLHRHSSGKTIDEGAVVFYAPVKTSGPTGSSSGPPGIVATAAAQFTKRPHK